MAQIGCQYCLTEACSPCCQSSPFAYVQLQKRTNAHTICWLVYDTSAFDQQVPTMQLGKIAAAFSLAEVIIIVSSKAGI